MGIPVKGNAPDDEDPFEKLAESKKVNVPSLGVVPSTAKPGTEVRAVSQSEDLRRAAEVAKSSTASLGKFQQNLNKKLESSAKTKGKKRQFESNTVDAESEKAKSLRVLDSITNKEPRLDMDAAVNKSLRRTWRGGRRRRSRGSRRER